MWTVEVTKSKSNPKRREFSVLGITNHKSTVVMGGGAPGALSLDPLVVYKANVTYWSLYYW